MRLSRDNPAPFGEARRMRCVVVCALVNLFALALFALLGAAGARGEEMRADISASVGNGHGRMIFTFSEETKTEVQVANGILVVAFRRPVALTIERLEKYLPGYVLAVRRDPDGTAVRFSLKRKVTVNAMEAGEKLFVDLLPEGWVGLPPGLPQEVVDDLAKRAREAERRARARPQKAASKPTLPIKLRLSTAPTFSRFAFEMTEPVVVELERDGQEMRILFDTPVKIELGEAKARLPAGVVGLDVAFEDDRSIVKLVLAPDAKAREFREERAYLIDVTPPPLGIGPLSIEQLAAEAIREPDAESKEKAAAAPPLAKVDADGDDIRPAPIDFVSAPDAFSNGPLAAKAKSQAGRLAISFPFAEPTAAAVFWRGEVLWIVFDSHRPIEVGEILADATRLVRGAEYAPAELGGVIRLKLTRALVPSVERDGNTWVLSIGDGVAASSRALPMRRASAENERAAILIPLEAPGQVHRLADPEVGDKIVAVTAMPPARGILRAQDFIEFRALVSVHGLALSPRADDLGVTLSSDGVVIGRPGGLVISELPPPPPPARKPVKKKAGPLDAEVFQAERESDYRLRESELIHAVSATPAGQRAEARIMLARFYLAHDFAAEAKGTLDAGAREDQEILNHQLFHLLRGLAELRFGRPEEALRDLLSPQLAGVSESMLLRAAAYAELGQWGEVRDSLRTGAAAFAAIPADFQRMVMLASLRAAVEVRDFTEASRLLRELEALSPPKEMRPTLELLAGRIAEGVGRHERAKPLYGAAAEGDSPAGAEAKLRLVEMRHALGELDRPKAIDRLEALEITWRGDRIELETIRLLARLYVAEGRYRDAFRLLDSALVFAPHSEITRSFQSEMARVFEDLFLTGRAETLPPVDALALYYDFAKLTPIGRRGDELIRRLADRLASVDLLDQAAELLQHQVQYRLSGAAKAQVAVRLAMIHLMNHKPADAVKALASTRIPDLPPDLREQRLLLEARALSESGRHEVALELIESIEGHAAERLRSDIAWAAKNWRAAGERIEKLLGERWKSEEALDAGERHDVLRAALAYALGDETIGLQRLREKYAEKMGEGAERQVVDLLAAPGGVNARTMAQAAKALASFDSLKSFFQIWRARYPERPLPADPLPTAGTARDKVTAR